MVEMRRLHTVVGCENGAVNEVGVDRNGEYCLSVGNDRLLRLWNIERGVCIKAYVGHGRPLHTGDIAEQNDRLCSAGEDSVIILWDVSTAKAIRRIRGHVGRVNCVRFHTSGQLLLSGGYDTKVHIWDCRSNMRDPVQTLSDADDSVTTVGQGNASIWTTSVDGKVRSYDLRNGQLVEDFIGNAVTNFALSRDNRCYLTSTLDSTHRLFDVVSGELLATYKGHKSTDFRVGLSFIGNEAQVISGSEDGRLHVWDLVEGNLAQSLDAHSSIVTSVAQASEGQHIVSASHEGDMIFWDVQR